MKRLIIIAMILFSVLAFAKSKPVVKKLSKAEKVMAMKKKLLGVKKK